MWMANWKQQDKSQHGAYSNIGEAVYDDDDRCEKVAASGCGDDSDCIGFTHCSRV